MSDDTTIAATTSAATPTTPAAPETAPARAQQPTFERTSINGAPVTERAAPAPDPAPAPAAAAEKPPEPKTEVKPEQAAKEKREAERLAILARQAKQLSRRQQQYQHEVAQREAQLKQYEEGLKKQQGDLQRQLDEMKEARSDPMKWLQRGGFTFDQLSEQLLNDGKVTPEVQLQQVKQSLDARAEELEKKVQAEAEERKKSEQQRIEAEKQRLVQEEQATIQRFHQGAVDFVQQNKEKYELTLFYREENEVPALIQAVWEQSAKADAVNAQREGRAPAGKLLSYAEAADMVEAHLLERWEKSRELKKLKERLAPPAAAQAAPAASPAAVEQSAPGQRPTLTNTLASPPAPRPNEFVSEDERWKRALAAMDAAAAQRGTRR